MKLLSEWEKEGGRANLVYHLYALIKENNFHPSRIASVYLSAFLIEGDKWCVYFYGNDKFCHDIKCYCLNKAKKFDNDAEAKEYVVATLINLGYKYDKRLLNIK